MTELREMLSISRSQLWRIFRTELKVSPLEYIRRVKLAEAKKLLEKGSLPLKEIAFQSGFRDRSHFSREFKKVYGVAPSKVALSRKANSAAT